MNPPTPAGWRSWLSGAAVTVLSAAVALYVAVRLVEAVWPVLVAATALVVGGYVTWVVHRHRDSGW
ncbi:MAG: hypothetical protein ACRDZR_00410 [Acidimicrobiales bacterium]